MSDSCVIFLLPMIENKPEERKIAWCGCCQITVFSLILQLFLIYLFHTNSITQHTHKTTITITHISGPRPHSGKQINSCQTKNKQADKGTQPKASQPKPNNNRTTAKSKEIHLPTKNIITKPKLFQNVIQYNWKTINSRTANDNTNSILLYLLGHQRGARGPVGMTRSSYHS